MAGSAMLAAGSAILAAAPAVLAAAPAVWQQRQQFGSSVSSLAALLNTQHYSIPSTIPSGRQAGRRGGQV